MTEGHEVAADNGDDTPAGELPFDQPVQPKPSRNAVAEGR
jgi:hypothetical protein